MVYMYNVPRAIFFFFWWEYSHGECCPNSEWLRQAYPSSRQSTPISLWSLRPQAG